MSCFADVVGVHLGSIHSPKRDYNNFNPGIYYKMDNGFTVGTYRNSIRKQSFYTGYTYEWKRFAITAGAITGYEGCKVCPLIFPTVKVGSFRLGFIPHIKATGANVFHLMYEKQIWH